MLFSDYVGVAQSVERRTHKPQVTGSIPVADTALYFIHIIG